MSSFLYDSPLIYPMLPQQPTILMYHCIPRRNDSGLNAAAFEDQLRLLRRHFRVVPIEDCLAERRPFERPRVALTLDDGMCNHADVAAPLLRKYGIPACFFVNSRHSVPGRYLWFNYLKALAQYFPYRGFMLEGEYVDMRPEHRADSIARLTEQLLLMRPHPSAMYDIIDRAMPRLEEFVSRQILREQVEGMSADQLAELSRDPLFTIGVHTVDHPLLPACDLAEAERQIVENRMWIEQVCGKPCNSIAYPVGAHNKTIVDLCRRLGFPRGFAVERPPNWNREMEIVRIGVYAQSLTVIGMKAAWGTRLRLGRWPVLRRLWAIARRVQHREYTVPNSVSTVTMRVARRLSEEAPTANAAPAIASSAATPGGLVTAAEFMPTRSGRQ